MDPVRTCREYLAGVLAPVGPTGAKHVFTGHVAIIVVVSTHIVGDEVHLSLSEGVRLIPQTCRDVTLLKHLLMIMGCKTQQMTFTKGLQLSVILRF